MLSTDTEVFVTYMDAGNDTAMLIDVSVVGNGKQQCGILEMVLGCLRGAGCRVHVIDATGKVDPNYTVVMGD